MKIVYFTLLSGTMAHFAFGQFPVDCSDAVEPTDPPVTDESVVPLVCTGYSTGNAGVECTSIGLPDALAYKFDNCGTEPEKADNCDDETNENGIHIVTFVDLLSLSWEVVDNLDLKVQAVIFKASNAAYVYNYIGSGLSSDSGLVGPINNGGNRAALSHVTFCFTDPTTPPNCPDPTVGTCCPPADGCEDICGDIVCPVPDEWECETVCRKKFTGGFCDVSTCDGDARKLTKQGRKRPIRFI